MLAIDTSTLYWIKPTNSNEYLSGLGNATALVALDAKDLRQQWKFIPKDSGYVIQNASQTAMNLYTSSTLKEVDVILKKDDDMWNVSIISQSPNTGTTVSIFYVGEKTTYLRNAGKPITSPTAGFNQEWILINVNDPGPGPGPEPTPIGNLVVRKNPLPDGQYRIRSFESKLLLTMNAGGSANVYVTEQGAVNDPTELLKQQEWSVKFNKATNSYEIINQSVNRYLSVKGPSADEATLSGQTSPARWVIQALDSVGVMFVIGLTGGPQPLSIGFSDYIPDGNDQVVLKPSDNIPSQIWFFETAHIITHDKFTATRDLKEGTYYIRNCSNGLFMEVLDRSSNLILDEKDKENQWMQFTLDYVDSVRPNFTLKHRLSGQYIVASGNLVTLTQNPGIHEKQWVALLQNGDSEPRYRISRPAETGSSGVITTSLGQRDRVRYSFDDITT